MNTMKCLALGVLAVSLPIASVAAPPSGNPVQSDYRWRNDDNTESSATWKAANSTPIAGVQREQNIRLRFALPHRGYYPPAQVFTGRVEYAESTNGPWRAVGRTDSGERFEMAATPWYSNGVPTTAQLGSGTFVPGQCVELPSNQGVVSYPKANTDLGENYSELEYCLKAKAKATRNTTYYFRLSREGRDIGIYFNGSDYVPVYLSYPAMTIENTDTSEPPVIRSALDTQNIPGLQVWSYEIMASGSEPLAYRAQGLPAGIMLSGNVLSGYATEYGNFNVTLTVSNAWGTATALLPLSVSVPETNLRAAKFSDPTHGSVTLSPNGSFVYTPELGYSGDDSFTYKVNDGELDSNPATVAIRVNSTNDAPVAVDDAYSLDEDTMLTPGAAVSVLANDKDPEGASMAAVKVTDPAHGTLTLNPDGMFSYTPNLNFCGSDSFTYRVSDGELTGNTATVHLTVNAVNDAPVIGFIPDQVMMEDETLVVPFSISDPDSDPEFMYVWNTGFGANGYLFALCGGSGTNRTLTILPRGLEDRNEEVYGSWDLSVYIEDGPKGAVGTIRSYRRFRVTVTARNDSPVAGNDAFSTAPGVVLNVPASGLLCNDMDNEGATLTAVKVSDPAHGSVSLNGNGSFAYTPAFGYSGGDSFTYKANDGAKDSNVATVSIDVETSAPNRSPALMAEGWAYPAVVTLPCGTELGIGAGDPDGDLLTYIWSKVSGPGTVTFTPNGLQNVAESAAAFSQAGSYVLSVTVSDGRGGTVTDDVSVVVNAAAAPPDLVVNETAVSVPEGAVAGFYVRLSKQPAGDVVITTTRTSGDSDIAVQSGGSLTFNVLNWGVYQPVTLAAAADADAVNGTATIRCSASGLTSVDVTAIEADNAGGGNHAPTVTASGSPTSGTTPLTVAFTANGVDEDGDTLTYAWTFGDGGTSTAQNPAHVYTSPGSYTSLVTVSDNKGGSASASVTITVTTGGGGVSATGGTVTDYTLNGITYRAHIFTNVGTASLNVTAGGPVEYLIIGGGGGGGRATSAYYSGAGGGAGGFLTGTSAVVSASSYPVVVGAGGGGAGTISVNGANGGNSSVFSLTAVGGGGGGSQSSTAGANGGSGGGSVGSGAVGAGTSGQGYAGGNGGGVANESGAGGGAGGVGGNTQGQGGIGRESAITGTNQKYAGGGSAGGESTVTPWGGGFGGSFAGAAAGNGAPNTGGGGGGGRVQGPAVVVGAPGNGGSGIVIVRYVVGGGDPNLDSDGDGIPDWWMQKYFLHTTAQAADLSRAADDPDGDGMSNWKEWRAGTVPTNKLSCLAMSGLASNPLNAGQFVVSWRSESNKLYTVQAATNLITGFTLTLGSNIPATYPVNVYTDSVGTAGCRFYRVKME